MSQPDTNSPRSVSCSQQLHKMSEKLCGHQLKERSQLRLPECSSARNIQPQSFTFKLNKDFTVCHQKTGDGSLRLCDTSDPSGASRCVCGYFSVSVATETRVRRRPEEFSSLVCCSENRYLDQKCLLLNQLSAATRGKYEIKLTNIKLQQRNVRNVISLCLSWRLIVSV